MSRHEFFENKLKRRPLGQFIPFEWRSNWRCQMAPLVEKYGADITIRTLRIAAKTAQLLTTGAAAAADIYTCCNQDEGFLQENLPRFR